MGSDAAMVNASIPAISKDFGKKKKVNRSAKLKQCKLDARREQWLSQVKNKDYKVTSGHASSPSSLSPSIPLPRAGKKNCALADDLEMRSRGEEKEGSVGLQDSDLESPNSSPTSSVMGSNSSRKDCTTNSICSGSSTSGSYSRSVSDADEEGEGEGEGEEEGSLDDWEAVADALTTNTDHHLPPNSECNTNTVESTTCDIQNEDHDTGILKKPDPNGTILRAWRPDDEFRPQSLPNLSKQRSFPVNLERHCGNGTMGWAHHGIASQPSACPICYEDLDLTDSSFIPCSCGFRLCLFCHKRILEADGRCPGCRKQYTPLVDGEMSANGGVVPLLPFRLSRSCSMSSRS